MEKIEDIMNDDYVVKDGAYNASKSSIFCQICQDIMIDPMMCMNCQNSFCKSCLEKWDREDKRCPNRCINPNYKKSRIMSNFLSNIKFTCKNCNNIINYDDMKRHFYSKCDTEKIDNNIFEIERTSSKGIFEIIDQNKKNIYEPKFKLKSKLNIYLYSLINIYFYSHYFRNFNNR